MEFKYIALGKDKKRFTAIVEAESVSAVINLVKSQGHIPLEVIQAGPKKAKLNERGFNLWSGKLKNRELAVFVRQLSSTLTAGIVLIEALETIGYDSENKKLRRAIEDIVTNIKKGMSFSSAVARSTNIFPQLFITMIIAGEESGRLSETLSNLAKYLEDSDKAIQKLKSGTRYPIFIFLFFVLVVFAITIFIMPQFKHIFLTINTELPILTRIVLGISEYLIKNLAWISLSIVVFIVMFLVLLRNSKFRLYFDSFKLKIPIFGELLKKSLLARFARTFSVLFSSGVSLSATLALSSDVTDNVYFSSVIDRVKYRVLSGDYLSDQMQKYNIFTKMFIKMVKIGEKTGKLKDMLKNNADYYDQEVERAIDNFTSLVEPVLIIFIGIVVLIVVVALYLPIFRLALIMAS